MIEKKLFVCEYCRTSYATKESCLECEKTHKTPDRILSYEYNPYKVDHSGYPKHIVCEMSDGKRVVYHR